MMILGKNGTEKRRGYQEKKRRSGGGTILDDAEDTREPSNFSLHHKGEPSIHCRSSSLAAGGSDLQIFSMFCNRETGRCGRPPIFFRAEEAGRKLREGRHVETAV
jgi:hypothetical protein